MMRIEVNTKLKFFFTVLAMTILGACTDEAKQAGEQKQTSRDEAARAAPAIAKPTLGSGTVFVHLFEWRWPDIAAECEDFLGPNGYAAVQVSPPQEHVQGPQWWTRYRPVSYQIESRSGTRAEFADMVQRCKTAGVDIYADALANHMADVGAGTGVAGSEYGEYSYPVPYSYNDFHHCGRNGSDTIANYQDLWEVQTCNLGNLPDLDTGNPAVQKKIAAYLNDLLNLGVTGFRLDAAKHISHNELGEILSLLDSRPFVFQEVIDRGGEPINAMAYLDNGSVTEFKYPMAMVEAFEGGRLDVLADLDSRAGFLPADKAVVFVDNHGLQRGHAGGEVLNYKYGELYNLANVFMLGWPYGYPKVMSSYRFEDSDQGPPDSRPVEDGICTSDWVCEHRRTAMTGMVGFRKTTEGTAVTDLQAFAEKVLSFGRGDKGHIVINISEETIDGTFVTRMKTGEYCNVIAAGTAENDCGGWSVSIGEGGVMQVSVAPMSAVVIHSNAMK
jgi:alpha-amylase